jgi:hypothetical protein
LDIKNNGIIKKDMALYKKIIIFFCLASVVLLMAEFTFAQRTLEVSLPSIADNPKITETPLLPDYVKYVFNFAIGIAGLVAFLSLIYGGFRHLTSAGNPAALKDANDQIFAGIIGLIVILSSWFILTTVNPLLVVIDPQYDVKELPGSITMSGVYLCKTDSEEAVDNCDGPFTSDQDGLSSGFNDETRYVRFVNSENTRYGAVLHKDSNLRGDCEILLSSGNEKEVYLMNKLGGEASSVSIIRLDPSISGGSVTLCEQPNCVKVNSDDTEEAWRVFTFNEGYDAGFDSNILRGFSSLKSYEYDNGHTIDGGVTGAGFFRWVDQGVSALRVNKYLAVLFEHDNYGGTCEVFSINDSNLSDGNPIDDEKASSMMIIKGTK